MTLLVKCEICILYLLEKGLIEVSDSNKFVLLFSFPRKENVSQHFQLE